MSRKLVVLAFLALLVGGVVVGVTPADAAQSRRSHAVLQRVTTGPATKNAEKSLNWSGYAVPAAAGDRITQVSGSWKVPMVKNLPPGFSSSWVGIGGYRTSDLIQAGTASSGHIDGNYAWYEMLPDSETPIFEGCNGDNACTVKQGDRMWSDIRNVGGDSWTITLINLGKGATPKWGWQKTVTYKSSLSSADFVYEAPHIAGAQVTPANAPHQEFGAGANFTINGVQKTLAPKMGSLILMTDPSGGYRFATPSSMGVDGHFNVCSYKRECY